MLFQNITIIDEDFNIRENMFVGVSEGRIDYIGDTMPAKTYSSKYEGKGRLLMAAFYNSHGHSPMSLMRGYGENMALQDWLTKRIFPFEDKLDSNAVYWGTMLSMAESMSFGIVSTSDMYYFTDDMVRAVLDSKMKANLSRAIVHFDESDPNKLPSVIEMKRTFEAYHNIEDEKIKMDVSIHGEYTSNPLAVSVVTDYGKSVGANMHIHISETKTEHEECKLRHGKTPVKYFYDLGALDLSTTAAHCVWVEDADFDMLKEKGVTVASNPMSNLKLASGVCNVPKLLSKGINVAIGTDSVASNNSLNFFEEIKTFAVASKMYFNDPTAVTPLEALKAATINGAKGQGRKDTGLVKEGFRADLIVLDIDKPHMIPVHNILNNLVYSADGRDVVMTMVDGKVVYKDGEFLTFDIERVKAEAKLCTDKILSML